MLVCSLRKWFSLSMARKMDYDIGREKRFFRALYLACSFLFLLANATSHSVCADDVLLVSNVNKRVGGQHFCEMDGSMMAAPRISKPISNLYGAAVPACYYPSS